jgi:hypothetical protein
MTFNNIVHYISILMKEHFTGRLILDFHDGKVSHNVKREITETIGEN